MPSAKRTGISSVMPIVDVILRLSAIIIGISSSLPSASWPISWRPSRSHTAITASRRPGISSTGRAPTNPNRCGFARRNRNAVCLDPAKPRQSSHATIVCPTAGAADCDDRLGLIVNQRRFKGASLTKHAATGYRNQAREHGERRIDQRGFRQTTACYSQPRRSDRRPLNTSRRHNCDIEIAQSLAGAAQRCERPDIATGGQHTLPWRNCSDGFGMMASEHDGIQGHHGIRSCW